MNISAEHLARIMFRARCEKIGITEEQAPLMGDAHEQQYMKWAEPIAEFLNTCDVEARAVARYIIDRVDIDQIEEISSTEYRLPNRVLP